MSFKKRRMMLIPEVNSESFVFFFERGTSGTSWSIRDYSIKNRVKDYGPQVFRWTADEIHQKAQHSLDAPTHHTGDLRFWHEHTRECNRLYLGTPAMAPPVPEAAARLTGQSPTHPSNGTFPVLNLQQLLDLPKGRKSQDMERILHSPKSEDWVTWNFFRVMLGQYPNGWWRHMVSAARRRNPDLAFAFDDRSLPTPRFWSLVRAPSEYEAQSRIRMLASTNPSWVLRAKALEPVEGSSEIDIALEHEKFVLFVEAKLGSDISMSTSYDPQRNQIIRNIDCLIESAGNRTPFFWMLARDEAPGRAYLQLMNNYKANPSFLIRDLPHRDAETLRHIAQNLTIILWSDFKELVCGPGADPETTAVKRELERRILGLGGEGMTNREKIIATSIRMAEIRNEFSDQAELEAEINQLNKRAVELTKEFERRSGLADELKQLETSLDQLVQDNALTILGPDEEVFALNAGGVGDSAQASGCSDTSISSPSINVNGEARSSIPKDWLHEALKTVSPREEMIITMRLGLQDGSMHTFEEIAEHFAVSPERVQQIYSKARRKLRDHIRETLEIIDLRPFATPEAQEALDGPDLKWLDQALKTVSPREEKIITMRLGLQDGSVHTFEEIAQHFAVDTERVQQIYLRARRSLGRQIRETLDRLPRIALEEKR
jgi:RNA polymerase sigma factor (sigma-70 family)